MEIIPQQGILIAFGELFLKSKGVQRLFRNKLEYNVRSLLKKEGIAFRFHEFRERIFIETAQLKLTQEVIKKIFGIAWYAECWFFKKADLKDIAYFLEKNYSTFIKEKESFALRLHQEHGIWGKDSRETIEELANPIQRTVNLSCPKKEIFVEVRRLGCFVYLQKNKGTGGLPGGSAGKVLSLVSGGIDSPVASWLAAKRGAENVWLHFHSFPLVSDISIQKVRELAQVFLRFQPKLRIYLVPFQRIQTQIKVFIEPRYLVLLYRRFMLKIAEEIAQREECSALVTGESLGQVSSQTLANIRIVEEATLLPILRPAIAMDKEEIIHLAEKIGTFDISVRPQEDCCTLFVPKHITANGSLETVKALEKKLAVRKLIAEALRGMEKEEY